MPGPRIDSSRGRSDSEGSLQSDPAAQNPHALHPPRQLLGSGALLSRVAAGPNADAVQGQRRLKGRGVALSRVAAQEEPNPASTLKMHLDAERTMLRELKDICRQRETETMERSLDALLEKVDKHMRTTNERLKEMMEKWPWHKATNLLCSSIIDSLDELKLKVLDEKLEMLAFEIEHYGAGKEQSRKADSLTDQYLTRTSERETPYPGLLTALHQLFEAHESIDSMHGYLDACAREGSKEIVKEFFNTNAKDPFNKFHYLSKRASLLKNADETTRDAVNEVVGFKILAAETFEKKMRLELNQGNYSSQELEERIRQVNLVNNNLNNFKYEYEDSALYDDKISERLKKAQNDLQKLKWNLIVRLEERTQQPEEPKVDDIFKENLHKICLFSEKLKGISSHNASTRAKHLDALLEEVDGLIEDTKKDLDEMKDRQPGDATNRLCSAIVHFLDDLKVQVLDEKAMDLLRDAGYWGPSDKIKHQMNSLLRQYSSTSSCRQFPRRLEALNQLLQAHDTIGTLEWDLKRIAREGSEKIKEDTLTTEPRKTSSNQWNKFHHLSKRVSLLERASDRTREAVYKLVGFKILAAETFVSTLRLELMNRNYSPQGLGEIIDRVNHAKDELNNFKYEYRGSALYNDDIAKRLNKAQSELQDLNSELMRLLGKRAL